MRKKRTKALAISPRVKEAVWERDGGRCIVCGSPNAAPNAHYIARSHGGLGIEENIATLCHDCHRIFDFGVAGEQETIGKILRAHFKIHYPDWDDDNLIYRKGF